MAYKVLSFVKAAWIKPLWKRFSWPVVETIYRVPRNIPILLKASSNIIRKLQCANCQKYQFFKVP